MSDDEANGEDGDEKTFSDEEDAELAREKAEFEER